ncbi:MAG TPA: hypothetical protein VK988_16240 [Acidimicrobiales bacterium]|nr:hypothetical protein [Acidimicrobiales bacterium]
MTAGVNLLPGGYAERLVERRRMGRTGGALLVLVALLAVVSFAQGRTLNRARSERDLEQVRTGQLSARRAELAPFRELADGVAQRERVLTVAMDTEISWSRVLASLSASFPPGASLISFNAESTLPAFSGNLPVPNGNTTSPIGSATYNGYSIEGFDPGLAQTLRLLATVPGLDEPRLQEGAETEIAGQSVTSFDGTAFLDSESLTRRYLDGLPPGEGVDPASAADGERVVAAPLNPVAESSK